jgi:hypothetical protein
MLAVERGTALVFRVHDPLDRCKVQLANRIALSMSPNVLAVVVPLTGFPRFGLQILKL